MPPLIILFIGLAITLTGWFAFDGGFAGVPVSFAGGWILAHGIIEAIQTGGLT